MTTTERITITIGGRHFTDAEFAELIGAADLPLADLRGRAKAIATALGLGSAITVTKAATNFAAMAAAERELDA